MRITRFGGRVKGAFKWITGSRSEYHGFRDYIYMHDSMEFEAKSYAATVFPNVHPMYLPPQ